MSTVAAADGSFPPYLQHFSFPSPQKNFLSSSTLYFFYFLRFFLNDDDAAPLVYKEYILNGREQGVKKREHSIQTGCVCTLVIRPRDASRLESNQLPSQNARVTHGSPVDRKKYYVQYIGNTRFSRPQSVSIHQLITALVGGRFFHRCRETQSE